MKEVLERERWDFFVTTNYRTVYWLTGVLGGAEVPCFFVLWADGRSRLVSGAALPEGAPVDDYRPLETYSIQRTITDLPGDALRLAELPSGGRYGGEGLLTLPGERCDALPAVLRLRKSKDDDEVDEIRASLRLCSAAYARAREVMAPGLTEIDVFVAMQEAVVRAAGGAAVLKGDFAVGQRSIAGGGAPTARVLAEGDLYPLDIFPETALYFGDTCRTFAVGRPREDQERAYLAVREATKLAESLVKPGVKASAVYKTVKEHLDAQAWTEKSFFHHVGHGIGHHGHEAPRIIPGTDDVFEVGDVFTIEPGVYVPGLGGGLRLEDNYVLRADGLENLFDFPFGL